jgi:hypothetical protein
MNAADLLALARTELDDEEEDYLWSDALLYQYLDLAQLEFAKQTECFKDSFTDSVVEVDVAANESTVELNPLIIRIEKAYLKSENTEVRVINENEIAQEYEGETWRTATGTPQFLVFDADSTYGRLIPTPTANDTIYLSVIRYPLRAVSATSTTIEIKDRRHQYMLLDWVKHLAYSVNDADVNNPELADKHKAAFLANCMQVRSETIQKHRRPGTVRYGGY